jgi:hypothetical protein
MRSKLLIEKKAQMKTFDQNKRKAEAMLKIKLDTDPSSYQDSYQDDNTSFNNSKMGSPLNA